jgi:peptidoglycan hydrolase-like protein with peptidoglycan-binding domain
VIDLQSRHGLEADGIVGARTWAVLMLKSSSG